MITWTPSAPSVIVQNTGNGLPQSLDAAVFNGQAFATRVVVGAVAAQSSSAGISNAAASGKDVYIDGIIAVLSAASQIAIGIAAAGFGVGSAWHSMKAGGVDAVATMRALNQVGIPHTVRTADIDPGAVLTTTWFPPRGPMLIPAGQAFAVGLLTVNVGLTLAVFGREY